MDILRADINVRGGLTLPSPRYPDIMAPYTLLYVDDEPDLLVLGKAFLESIGDFVIDTRGSAPEGMEALRARQYDAVISDYQMPGMDGLMFLQAVRKEFGDTPFILFTGRGREAVVIEAINSGVDFYLQKGGDVRAQFAELSHKVRMAVERKRAVDERIESEKRLTSIFHASPIHQIITEFATGKILDINDRFLNDLKLSRSEVLGRTLEGIGLALDRDQYATMILRLERGGIVRNAELIIRAGDGRIFTTLTSMTRVKVHNQDLIYTQSVDITDQKKAQQTINALLNAPPDVSLLLDNHGTILAANEAASCRYDMLLVNLIGTNAFTLISPAYAWLRQEKVNEVIRTGKPLVFLDDRTGRSYETHLYPVIGSGGEVTAVAVHSHDITEERKAREALHESEAKYRLVVEHSHDIIYIYRDDRFLFINKQAEQLTGFTHDELMERDIWDFIHPDDRKRLKASAAQRFAGGNVSSSFEARIIRKDGGVRDGEFFVDLIDFLGSPAILGIARDITEKKRAEEAIREREEQLRSLSDNLPSGVVYQAIHEPGGTRRFTHVSAGFERIHEIPAADVLRDPGVFYSQILPEDRPAVKEAADRALASLSLFSFETRIRTPSGKEKWVLIRSAPRVVAGGGILWDGIELDITAAKQAEGELKAACEQVAASQEELKRQVDELKAGQELLAESGEKYRTLVENTQDGVFIAQEGKLLFANAAFSSLTGYTPEDLIGKSFVFLVAPEDREMVLSRHENRLLGNTPPARYEFSLLHRDGATRVRVKIQVGTGIYGGRPATIGTLHDITEERRREQALAESEELLRKMVATIPDIIVRADLEGRITFINENGARLAGSPDPSTIIGRSMFSFFAPESLPEAIANTKLMFERPLGPKEYTVVTLDGRRILMEVNGDVLRSPEGTPFGMVYICRDITERKEAETALRESEQDYRMIIENMQDVFYRTDGEGLITMISPYGARLVGFASPGEIIGKYRATDFYPDPREREELLRYLRENGVVSGYPITLRDRHGELHHATASSRILYDNDGNISGIEGILHDVTSLKRVENALRQANRQITLISGITRHDIHNQLLALGGWLELSRASVLDPDRMLEMITREQRIASIIEEQINFTLFFDEMGVREPAWLDPLPLIRKSKEALPFGNIRLEVDVAGFEIFADLLFEKVIYNLFDNALKYGGGSITRIRISSLRDGPDLVLVVEDDGTGIPMEDKGRLFERGYGKNTGLGLFLIREILAITGITIRENGMYGYGARFELHIPEGVFRRKEPCV